MHEKKVRDNTKLKALESKRNASLKASKNLIAAIEQGIITEQTKIRLKELESEITQLDFDIEQEKMRSYSYLTVPMIEKYLQSAIYGEITDMAVRKRLVNTFVREVIYSPDKIIITLNFSDRYDTPDITPDYIKDIEKQSETETAFPLPQSSNILASFPPTRKDRSKTCPFFVA